MTHLIKIIRHGCKRLGVEVGGELHIVAVDGAVAFIGGCSDTFGGWRWISGRSFERREAEGVLLMPEGNPFHA